jgi:hypothetical protein
MPTDANLDERLADAADQWRHEVDGLFATVDWSVRSRRHGLGALLSSTRWRLASAGAIAILAVAITLAIVLTRPDAPARHVPAADCAAPMLTLQPHTVAPTSVAPGQVLSVVGRYWVDGCQDDGRGGPRMLIADVRVVLHTSDGHTRTLAVAHPRGNAGTFRIQVTVPLGSPAGAAILDDAAGKAYRTIELRIT